MKPDRVIGVNTNARYQEAVSSFTPIIDHRIGSSGTLLYPFLVLEAKREKGAPGFRSVEMQTAFPIRSMLHLQHQLRRTSDQRLDPMVWFFAFQGDIWRLYGCTLDNDRVVRRPSGEDIRWKSLNNVLESVRSVARLDRYAERSFANISDRRLHMVLGQRRLSSSDQALLGAP